MSSLRHLFLLTAAALSTAVHAAGTITVITRCSNTLTLDAGSASGTLATGATSAPITYGTDAIEVRVYTDATKPLILEAIAAGGMVYYDVASLDGNVVGSYTVASSNGDCPSITCAEREQCGTTQTCTDGSSLTWTL